MKNTFMFILGASFGVGAAIGINAVSKNKENIKKSVNSIIDETSKLMG